MITHRILLTLLAGFAPRAAAISPQPRAFTGTIAKVDAAARGATLLREDTRTPLA